MNIKTLYHESYKIRRKKAKMWQWYDNLFLGALIIIFLISLIINDWNVAFLSIVLTLIILLNYWKNHQKELKFAQAQNQRHKHCLFYK